MLPSELAASSATGVSRTATAFSSNSGGGRQRRHHCFQQSATRAAIGGLAGLGSARVERLVTVEFGPSPSRRFAKAVAEARSGAGECSEVEPGRYRVGFVLGEGEAAYAGLARLLERVRHWRATEVYEDEELVSTYQARDIKVVDCPLRETGWHRAGVRSAGCSAAFRRVRCRPALLSQLWALASVWAGRSRRG